MLKRRVPQALRTAWRSGDSLVTVTVKRQTPGGTWKRLATSTTNRFGLFERTFRMHPTGRVRGRLGSLDAPLPFSLTAVPDHSYNTFRLPNLLEPEKKFG